MCRPDRDDRKLWFIIDELPSLNQIPDLPKAMAEVRKYGGCFVIGFQNITQLEELYGRPGAQTINSLAGTKVMFRCADSETSKRLSLFLGEQEVVEPNESISFGAHQMRDGVSLSDQRRTKPTISSTDLLQLNNLEAYLKLPGNFPVTKLKFTYHDIPSIAEPFVKKGIRLAEVLSFPEKEVRRKIQK